MRTTKQTMPIGFDSYAWATMLSWIRQAYDFELAVKVSMAVRDHLVKLTLVLS